VVADGHQFRPEDVGRGGQRERDALADVGPSLRRSQFLSRRLGEYRTVQTTRKFTTRRSGCFASGQCIRGVAQPRRRVSLDTVVPCRSLRCGTVVVALGSVSTSEPSVASVAPSSLTVTATAANALNPRHALSGGEGHRKRASERSYCPRRSFTWSIRCWTRSALPMSWRIRRPSSPAAARASSAISSASPMVSATPTTAKEREVVV